MEAPSGLEEGLRAGMIKPTRSISRRTARSLSSASLRKKSDRSLVSKAGSHPLRALFANLHEVILGTRLVVLFPAVPLAIAAHYCGFGHVWVFALSLLALVPLAERLSFLTEQVTFFTGPTIGGLLNATCGNATELIISIFALHNGKVDIVKWSLAGSVLSNLLLVLGSSLLVGGVANIHDEQRFDRRQADVNSSLLLLGALCQVLPLTLRHVNRATGAAAALYSSLALSRACSIVMLLSYIAYLFFQLKTHRQFFEAQENGDDEDGGEGDGEPAIGFCASLVWLAAMTVVIALLSEYIVSTIEEAAKSWNLSLGFISVILLPIVGNAAEHAGSIIFAYKNKLDISLGVSLGSSTQISMFVVPFSALVAWIMGVRMDLDFGLLETGSLVAAILITAFTLQDGTSHYMKGLVLLLCYVAVAASFFVLKTKPAGHSSAIKMGVLSS